MNASDNVSNPIKGRPTSIPLLIAFGAIGVVAYFAGPIVMAYAFLYQEQALSKANYESARYANAQRQPEAGPNPGMPAMGGQPAGADGARPDPEELFKRRDENGDGKLEGSEISERMQSRIADLDKDGDGAISKEEFMAQRRTGGNANSPSAPSVEAALADAKPETPATPVVTEDPVKDAPKE